MKETCKLRISLPSVNYVSIVYMTINDLACCILYLVHTDQLLLLGFPFVFQRWPPIKLQEIKEIKRREGLEGSDPRGRRARPRAPLCASPWPPGVRFQPGNLCKQGCPTPHEGPVMALFTRPVAPSLSSSMRLMNWCLSLISN